MADMQIDMSKSSFPKSCTFPAKLWNLANDPENKSVFWSVSGDEVIINQQQFENELMSPEKKSKIFKTTNFNSFIRQLNLYGFRKVINRLIQASDQHYFQNPNFKRGQPELLIKIKRLTVGYKAKILFEDKMRLRAQAINPKHQHNTAAEKTGQYLYF